MVSWLSWTPDRAVKIRALAELLCCVLWQDTRLSRGLSPFHAGV